MRLDRKMPWQLDGGDQAAGQEVRRRRAARPDPDLRGRAHERTLVHRHRRSADGQAGATTGCGLAAWARPPCWQLGTSAARPARGDWSVVGLVFMWVLDDGPVGDADRAAAEWLEDRRTPTINSLTHYGSMLSDTLVKVVLVAVVGGAMVLIWRRWHDGVFLALAVISRRPCS